jgi:hypothetical protein
MKCYEEDNLFENKYNIEMIKKIFETDEIISGIIKNYNISLEPLDYIGRCIEQIDTFYSHNENDNKMEIQ